MFHPFGCERFGPVNAYMIVRCGCPDLGPDLLGGGTVGHVAWFGDVVMTPILGVCWADSTTGWPAG